MALDNLVNAACKRGRTYVVSKIGQANLRSGAHYTNAADQEPESAFLDGKDVLDPRPHPGTGSIAAGDVIRHFLASGLLALELWPEAATLEQGEVAAER